MIELKNSIPLSSKISLMLVLRIIMNYKNKCSNFNRKMI